MTSPSQTARRCAVCRKPEAAEFKPFCSRRCADVDLQRWFAGAYAIPAEASSDDAEDANHEE